jgi:hypothetical protein
MIDAKCKTEAFDWLRKKQRRKKKRLEIKWWYCKSMEALVLLII